jgi:hypothetical protein
MADWNDDVARNRGKDTLVRERWCVQQQGIYVKSAHACLSIDKNIGLVAKPYNIGRRNQTMLG